MAAAPADKPPKLLGYVEIKVWDALTQREKVAVLQVNESRTPVGYDGAIRSAAFSPDGKLLAVPAGEDLAKVWDVATGKEVLALTIDAGPAGTPFQSVAFTPDGKKLLAADRDHVFEWDLTNRAAQTLAAHRSGLIVFGPGGGLAAGEEKKFGGARVFEPRSGRDQTLLATPSTPQEMLFSPNGKKLAVASKGIDRSTPTLQVFDLGSAKGEMMAVGYTPAAFAPDGSLLAYWEPLGREVVLWQVGKGEIRRVFHGHDRLTALAFSPNGRTLATAGRDRPVQTRGGFPVEAAEHSIRVWDPATGKQLNTMSGHRVRIDVLVFSSDGRHLAAAGCEQRLDPSDKEWIDAHPLDQTVDKAPVVLRPKPPAAEEPMEKPPERSVLPIVVGAFGVLTALILAWACWRVVWIKRQTAAPPKG